MGTCNRYSSKMEEKTGNAFKKYGCFVAKYPWQVIAVVVVVNLSLGIGMLKLNFVVDVERVYTPIGSQASKDAEKLKYLFPDQSGSNYIGYQMPDLGKYGEVIVVPNSGNIVNGTFLAQLKDFYTFLLSINTTDSSGQTVTLDDICARHFGTCAIDGDVFVDPYFISDINSGKPVSFPYYMHPQRGPIYYEHLVGDASVSNFILDSAKMVLFRVNLRTDSEYYKETAKKWQNSFLAKMKSYSSSNFQLAYSHADSLSEELNGSVFGDIKLFAITFTIIIAYSMFATMTARCDYVGQKSNLAFAGVIASGLSIVSAFGIGCACGLEFVSVAGAVPFVIIGTGVDDMFMLLSGIMNADYAKSPEERVGEMMRSSGVSITITSLTDLLAFAAGASSIFLSVRNFCIYAGLAVTICYINQVTLFVASIALNERRTKQNRHFLACCIRLENSLDTPNHHCTGRPPVSVWESESYLDRFPKWLLPKVIRSIPAQIVILFVFAGYLAISIWGIVCLEEGLVLQNVVSDSSYYYKFREYFDKDFTEAIPVSFVLENITSYSDDSMQLKIIALVSNAKSENTIKDSIEINWLAEYRLDHINYSNVTEQDFIKGLRAFLGNIRNIRFQNDVIISSSNNSIVASRIYVMSESIKHSQAQGNFMLQMRNLATESSLQVFAFSPAFLFFEQYVVILSQTVQTLGIAVAMMFVVTCIFMPHPLMLLYITLTVAMITTGVMGFLSFLGLTLSFITMIHTIMSIGFSIDFATHICHGYMISDGKDKTDLMQKCFDKAGAPIFHGAMSSLLGVFMLAFSKSYAFSSFFKVLSIVIGFGFIHAVFLLPVLLTLTYPSSQSGIDPSRQSNTTQSPNLELQNTTHTS